MGTINQNVIEGTRIRRGDLLGTVGGSDPVIGAEGNIIGCETRTFRHLHFGIYRDLDGSGDWSSELVDKAVDPGGFRGGSDPWVKAGGPESRWLWDFPRSSIEIAGKLATIVIDNSAEIQADFPEDYFLHAVTLELARETINAAPYHPQWVVRLPFWLHLVGSELGAQSIAISPTREPFTLSIGFNNADFDHLDRDNLVLFHYNEYLKKWEPIKSKLHPVKPFMSAQTTDLGFFSLQAPVLCPTDEFINDDDFYGAVSAPLYGSSVRRVFDIKEDEDGSGSELKLAEPTPSRPKTFNLGWILCWRSLTWMELHRLLRMTI